MRKRWSKDVERTPRGEINCASCARELMVALGEMISNSDHAAPISTGSHEASADALIQLAETSLFRVGALPVVPLPWEMSAARLQLN